MQAIETGEVEALTKRKSEVPPEVATFIRLPGLGPKTARRLWQELGITTVADLRAAAEAQELRKVAGHRGEARGADPRRARQAEGGRGAAPRAARQHAAEAARGRGRRGRAPGGGARLDRRLGAALPRDGARPRPDRDRDRRARADRRVLLVPVGRRGGGEGRHEGDGRRARRPALRPARRPARVVRQPARSTSPARRTTTSPCARRPCGAGSRSPSTASPRSRPARCTRSRTRRTSTRFLGYEWIPPELRENGGELEAARNGALPKLVELGDLRGDLHTHTTWSDGKDSLDAMVAPRGREGLRVLRDLRPLAPAARRAARAAARGDRRAATSRCRSRCSRGSR